MISGKKYTVKGLNHAKLLSDFTKLNIPIKNVRRNKDILSFVAKVRDDIRIVDYLQNKCYNVLSCESVGFSRFYDAVKNNIVIVLAAIIMVALIAVTGNFCFTIKLDTTKDRDTVIQVLEDYGVKIGCNLARIDFDSLENYLENNIDGISYAIVDINGSTLSVELIDSLPKTDVIDYNKSDDIVAVRAGVITRIVCLSGTPLVSVGDTVSVGQILIKGVKTFRDGTTEDVKAVGEVYASVSLSHSLEYSPCVVEYVRTGEKQILTSFDVYGHNTDSLGKITFHKYETETKFYTFFPTGIVAEITYVYELQPKLTYYTYTERFPLLAERAEELARNEADFIVLDVITAESGNIITVTVTGEMLISE